MRSKPYIVEYDPQLIAFDGTKRPWAIVNKKDKVFVIWAYTNLWDAGARMEKMNRAYFAG